jgi:hypothetical protein
LRPALSFAQQGLCRFSRRRQLSASDAAEPNTEESREPLGRVLNADCKLAGASERRCRLK